MTEVIPLKTTPSPRLLSIDALRGFVMLWLFGLGELLASIQHAHSSPFTQKLAEQMKHLD